MSKATEERRKEIYKIVVEKTHVRIEELAELLQVSDETIRKDIHIMDKQGLIQKGHGFVEVKKDYYQLPVDVKMTEHAYEKECIAQKAITFIPNNSIVYLDHSSTAIRLARYLPLRKGLTVITNSLAIAQSLTQSDHDLIMIGGRVNKKSNAAAGVFADNMIDALKIDIAFTGTDGFLHMQGPTTFSMEEMEVKQHIMKQARVNILICDASKFRKSAEYAFARFSDFDVLITNELSEQEKEQVKEVKQLVCVK